MSKLQPGEEPGWIDARGYRQVKIGNRNVRYHRYLMEQKLGRRLEPWEVVHHINEDKLDNRIENLEILDYGEHTTLHHSGNSHSSETKSGMVLFRQMRAEIDRLRKVNSDMYEALKRFVVECDGERYLMPPTNEMINQGIRALAKADGK